MIQVSAIFWFPSRRWPSRSALSPVWKNSCPCARDWNKILGGSCIGWHLDSSYLICKEVFCKMSPHVVPCRPMSCCVALVHVISLSWRNNFSTRSWRNRNLCISPKMIVNDSRWQSMTACGSAVCMISLSWESAITWPLLRDQNITNVGTPWHPLAPCGAPGSMVLL